VNELFKNNVEGLDSLSTINAWPICEEPHCKHHFSIDSIASMTVDIVFIEKEKRKLNGIIYEKSIQACQ